MRLSELSCCIKASFSVGSMDSTAAQNTKRVTGGTVPSLGGTHWFSPRDRTSNQQGWAGQSRARVFKLIVVMGYTPISHLSATSSEQNFISTVTTQRKQVHKEQVRRTCSPVLAAVVSGLRITHNSFFSPLFCTL